MIFFKNAKLRKAACANDAVQVAALLAAGADPESRDSYGDTVTYDAVRTNSAGSVRALVAHGAKLDENLRSRGTLLHQAARGGSTAVADILVAALPSLLDSTDGEEATPLHAAAAQGHEEMARFLLERKPALLEAEDRNGCTPLHVAAMNGRAEIVALLLEKGASPAARNASNRMPLFLAQKGNHSQVVEILKPLTPAAKYNAVAVAGTEADPWEKLADQRIARVMTEEPIGYRVTEIFNFESRERIRILHNLATGADQMEARFFDEFPDKAAIEAARAALLERGGTAPEAAMGDKPLRLPRPPGA